MAKVIKSPQLSRQTETQVVLTFWYLPIVSIVVPFFGLTNSILRILKGNPQKELQWRL